MSGATRRNKGARGERDVVNYLKSVGIDARREVRTGDYTSPDEGDIRTGLTAFEVKHYAKPLTDGQVEQFVSKLQGQKPFDGIGVLVERRNRVTKGETWYAYLSADDAARLLESPVRGMRGTVRMPLGLVVERLLVGGWVRYTPEAGEFVSEPLVVSWRDIDDLVEKLSSGEITVNRARELLGIRDYL